MRAGPQSRDLNLPAALLGEIVGDVLVPSCLISEIVKTQVMGTSLQEDCRTASACLILFVQPAAAAHDHAVPVNSPPV